MSDHKSAWRDEFMFRLMLSTASRLAETTGLNVGDVWNGVDARERLEILGKGNKLRTVPLNKEIRSYIIKYLKAKKRNGEDVSMDAPLFLSRNKRRITPRAVQLNFDKWVTLSGIEGKFSPHALRHTVGTELMRKKGNIRWVQEFLGHKFITTTQIYCGVTKEDMVECANLLMA